MTMWDRTKPLSIAAESAEVKQIMNNGGKDIIELIVATAHRIYEADTEAVEQKTTRDAQLFKDRKTEKDWSDLIRADNQGTTVECSEEVEAEWVAKDEPVVYLNYRQRPLAVTDNKDHTPWQWAMKCIDELMEKDKLKWVPLGTFENDQTVGPPLRAETLRLPH